MRAGESGECGACGKSACVCVVGGGCRCVPPVSKIDLRRMGERPPALWKTLSEAWTQATMSILTSNHMNMSESAVRAHHMSDAA